MQLDVLVRIIFETVINIIVAYGSARAERYPFPFLGGQGIGMMMKLGHGQRAVQHHIMDGVAQITKTAPQSGDQFVVYDDAPVFIAFFLGGFAYRMPEGKNLAGVNHQLVQFLRRPAGC